MGQSGVETNVEWGEGGRGKISAHQSRKLDFQMFGLNCIWLHNLNTSQSTEDRWQMSATTVSKMQWLLVAQRNQPRQVIKHAKTMHCKIKKKNRLEQLPTGKYHAQTADVCLCQLLHSAHGTRAHLLSAIMLFVHVQVFADASGFPLTAPQNRKLRGVLNMYQLFHDLAVDLCSTSGDLNHAKSF